MSSDEPQLQDPLIDRDSASPESDAGPSPSKKRKRERDAEVPAEGASKKALKKAKKRKASKMEEEDLDLEAGVNKAFSQMDSQLLADYVAQKTRKFQTELSSIELEDKYIKGTVALTRKGITESN